jgi:hypothetical protein
VTDSASVLPPSSISPSISHKLRSFTGRSWIDDFQSWFNKPPKEVASISMLNLARSNLGVRLRSIDEATLSERQKKIHASVTEMLKVPAEPNTITEDQGWDKIFEAESLVALLHAGEGLRQEMGAYLQDLTDLNKAGILSDRAVKSYSTFQLTARFPDRTTPCCARSCAS